MVLLFGFIGLVNLGRLVFSLSCLFGRFGVLVGPLGVKRGDPAKVGALRAPTGGQKGRPSKPRGGPGRPVRVGEAQRTRKSNEKTKQNTKRTKTKECTSIL